jgi:hypothetical protein
MPKLVLQSVFGGDAFPEVGEPTGIYPSPDGRYIAIAGTVADYAWHATSLLNRVFVYDAASLDPIADIDTGEYPINDVAWHSVETILAIGTGHYDGGFYFQGDLTLYDLRERRRARLFSLKGSPSGRQVVACAFQKDGSLGIQAMPAEGPGPLTSYRVQSFSIPESLWRRFEERAIPPFEYFEESPLPRTGWEVVQEQWPDTQPIMNELAGMAATRGRLYEPRWMASKVAWAPDGRVLAVRNRTALEAWQLDGTLSFHIPHRSDGMRVTLSADGGKAYCRVWSGNPDDDFRENPDKYAAIVEVDLESGAAREIETDPTDTAPSGYRRFRVEGAPSPYYYRASLEPKDKWLNSKSGWIATEDATTSELRELFPLEWDEERDAYLTPDASAYVDDGFGPGMVTCSHVLKIPSTGPRIEINRRQLPDGRCLWSKHIEHPAVALTHLVGVDLVAFSLRDARLGLLSSADGQTVSEEPASINGIPTGIVSLASRGDEVAAGTIDGRVALYRLEL